MVFFTGCQHFVLLSIIVLLKFTNIEISTSANKMIFRDRSTTKKKEMDSYIFLYLSECSSLKRMPRTRLEFELDSPSSYFEPLPITSPACPRI